jgi:hypothetical protein
MNAFVQAVHDSAAIGGEMKRMLLSAGIVGVICCMFWGIQEWGIRMTVVALGWLGGSCLGLAALLSLCAIVIGLL